MAGAASIFQRRVGLIRWRAQGQPGTTCAPCVAFCPGTWDGARRCAKVARSAMF
jgi:hypothetical protein